MQNYVAMKKISMLILLATLILVYNKLYSQWTSNPLENTPIAETSGEQALPKLVVDSDGYAYVSWFSNEAGNYNVRLQRLDPDGNAVWADGGLLVSDEPQDSWITDYDLTVDAAGYAVLVFSDIRTGESNPVGYRISPNGEMMWGDSGIMLTNNNDFDPSPKVCVTEAGNAVFAWQSVPTGDSKVRLQKVAPDGQLLWGDGIVLSQAGANFTAPYVAPADGDHVFLIWHKETGPFWSPNRGLYAQKLDIDGSFMWASDVVIYAPVASGPVVYLEMCSDEAGGVILTWYRSISASQFHCYVQRMEASGNLTMPANGVMVSTSTDRIRMYPEPAFLSQSQEIVIVFSEQSTNQNFRGIYVQKLDLQGNRLWGDEGIELIALSGNDYGHFRADGFGDKVICVYQAAEFGNALHSKMQAFMLDSNGSFVWQEQFIDLSTVQSEKLHNVMTHYYEGQWVTVWQDRRHDMGDIYAQNIQPDGTLGIVPTFTGAVDKPQAFTIYPNPFSEAFYFNNLEPESFPAILEVFDSAGDKVMTQTINSADQFIMTGQLSHGLYFIRLITGSGEMLHSKAIKN